MEESRINGLLDTKALGCTTESGALVTGLLYCQQAKELLDGLTETVHDLVLLHAEQFQSLIGGDLDSTRSMICFTWRTSGKPWLNAPT